MQELRVFMISDFSKVKKKEDLNYGRMEFT